MKVVLLIIKLCIAISLIAGVYYLGRILMDKIATKQTGILINPFSGPLFKPFLICLGIFMFFSFLYSFLTRKS